MSLFQTIESDAPKGMTILTRRGLAAGILASAAFAGAPASTLAQGLKTRELPPARTAGGMPLMDAVKLRRSTREYADRPLTDQVLSDLLWAAFGINRPDGGRTAPYSRHIIAIDVYAAMADGVWLYEPKAHTLLPVIKDDIRAQTGVQDFVGGAPLNLIYVGHRERMPDLGDEEARLNISVDAGFIGQNVYLFCASEGLATVFRGALDANKLGRTLQLAGQEFVTFAQTVGYPRA
jgi:nitroreductase